MTKKTVNFQLEPVQTDFVNDTTHDFVGLVGGFRAGKTYAAVHKAIKLATLNPGRHGALLEPVQAMVRRTLLPVIWKVLKEDFKWTKGKQYSYRASNPESIVIHFPQGDTEIYLCGAENFDRLAGITLAWFGFDEADRCTRKEIAIKAFNELTARLTNGPCVQGFVTSTPEGFHFMHHHFVENGVYLDGEKKGQPRTDRRLYRIRTEDNPYVPKKYIDRIRANYPARIAEALLNGEFINLLTGNVYASFSREKNSHTKTLDDFPHHKLCVGMDFNKGAMSAVIAVIDSEYRAWVVDEITGEQNTASMIERLRRDYPLHCQWGAIEIYPDSSGKNGSANADESSITQLKLAGFRCTYSGNNPSINDQRVPSVNRAFECSQLMVNIERCPMLMKGLEQQCYRDGKPDKSGGIDHCLDALGYFMHQEFPIEDRDKLIVVE